MATLGEKVRRIRQRRGLTLNQLAALTKVSSVTIHNIEKDIYEPKISTLIDLSQALGTPLNYFIDIGPKGLFTRRAYDEKPGRGRRKKDHQFDLPQLSRLELPEGGEFILSEDPGQMFVMHLVFGRIRVEAGDRELHIIPGDNFYVELFEEAKLVALEASLGVMTFCAEVKRA